MDKRARRQLDTLLSQVGIAVIACDATGQLTTPGLAHGVTWDYEPLPDSQVLNHIDLYDADGTTPLRLQDMPLTRARQGETVVDAVLTTRQPGGCLSYLLCSASPVTDDAGRPHGAVAVVQDITAQRLASRDAAHIRGRLLDTINHEFRTPLTSVLGHAVMLTDVVDDLPTHTRPSVHALLEGALRMRNLMGDLSVLVDTANHLRLRPRHGNMASLIRDAANEYRPAMEARSIRLAVDVPDRLVATVDPAEIRRAVAELLTNAAVYAPDSSTVTVTLDSLDRYVEITIADQGSGIPNKDRDRLLHPFERGSHLHQPLNSKGLGLAVASTIAHAHGGCLTLADNDPSGLRAIMRVPRHPIPRTGRLRALAASAASEV
jgi:signal transduction histidine kinase